MRAPLTAVALLFLGLAQPADDEGGGGLRFDRQEISTDASAESTGIVAAADVTRTDTDAGTEIVDLGPDPFANCDVLANLGLAELSNLTGVPLPESAEPGDEPAEAVDATLYVLVYCNAAIVEFWEQTDPVPGEILDILVQSARNRTPIAPPLPTFSPDGTSVPFLAQLPTWLWMTDDIWTPATASASIPEIPITVTVTATPTVLTWDPGDGEPPITCGQGIEWSPAAAEIADGNPPPGACTHTYTSTAGVGGKPALETTTVLDYDVEATCAPAPLCGNLNQPADVSVAASSTVVVIQVKGTITE